MCQYDLRCKVQRHRPGTVCPYNRGGRRTPRPAPSPIPPSSLRRTPSSVPAGNLRPTPMANAGIAAGPVLSGGRYARAAAADGLSLVDLLVLLIIWRSWERFHAVTGMWGVAIVTVLVVLPFTAAGWLSRHCTAWNSTAAGRCAKVRPQPFRRCAVPAHSHRSQLVTAHEVGAVAAFIVGLLGLWFLVAF